MFCPFNLELISHHKIMTNIVIKLDNLYLQERKVYDLPANSFLELLTKIKGKGKKHFKQNNLEWWEGKVL